MGLILLDKVFDEGLEYMETNATTISLSDDTAQPTNVTEADATYLIAKVTVDSSDFTIGDGDTSGRKIAVAAQVDISVTNTGTAAYVNIYSGTELLYTGDLSSTLVVGAGVVTIPTFDIEFRDLAAE